jgi:hypothetical protein
VSPLRVIEASLSLCALLGVFEQLLKKGVLLALAHLTHVGNLRLGKFDVSLVVFPVETDLILYDVNQQSLTVLVPDTLHFRRVE